MSSLADDPNPSKEEYETWISLQKKFAIVLDTGTFLNHLPELDRALKQRNPFILFTLPQQVITDLEEAEGVNDLKGKATEALKLISSTSSNLMWSHPGPNVPFGKESIEQLKSSAPSSKFADIFSVQSDYQRGYELSPGSKVITFGRSDNLPSNVFNWDAVMDKLFKY